MITSQGFLRKQISEAILRYKNKKVHRAITLAVTGSISAYKAADITSQLTRIGIWKKVLIVLQPENLSPFNLASSFKKNPVGLEVW